MCPYLQEKHRISVTKSDLLRKISDVYFEDQKETMKNVRAYSVLKHAVHTVTKAYEYCSKIHKHNTMDTRDVQ